MLSQLCKGICEYLEWDSDQGVTVLGLGSPWADKINQYLCIKIVQYHLNNAMT